MGLNPTIIRILICTMLLSSPVVSSSSARLSALYYTTGARPWMGASSLVGTSLRRGDATVMKLVWAPKTHVAHLAETLTLYYI
jgi:hypothetical protein